jgi:hypothetical protein
MRGERIEFRPLTATIGVEVSRVDPGKVSFD